MLRRNSTTTWGHRTKPIPPRWVPLVVLRATQRSTSLAVEGHSRMRQTNGSLHRRWWNDGQTQHETTCFKPWTLHLHGEKPISNSKTTLHAMAFPNGCILTSLARHGLSWSPTWRCASFRSQICSCRTKGGYSHGPKGGHTMRVETKAASTCPPAPSCRVVRRTCKRIRRRL